MTPTIAHVKTRPAVVISNNVGNQFADRVIVAPITSTNVAKLYPFEMKVEAGEGGLVQPGKVLLDQIRTVDKKRLGAKLGMLSPARVEEVNRAIRVSLAV